MVNAKLLKKIILVLIFILISCIIFTRTTYASTIDEMMTSAQEFLNKGENNAINQVNLKNTSDYIYNTLLVIAVAIAVIVGAYLGIKFMVESAEDKAKIKESLIPFIVGCFIIFGAFGIWKIAVNVGTSISGDSSYSGGKGGYYENDGDKGLSEYYDYCSVCGKKITSSEERHNKKCNDCK